MGDFFYAVHTVARVIFLHSRVLTIAQKMIIVLISPNVALSIE